MEHKERSGFVAGRFNPATMARSARRRGGTAGSSTRPPRLGSRHLVDVIVLARVLGHLDADLLPLAGLGDGLVLDLHGYDPLAEVARVSKDAAGVANPQRSGLDAYRRDGKMSVVVRDDADELLAGERLGARGGRGGLRLGR